MERKKEINREKKRKCKIGLLLLNWFSYRREKLWRDSSYTSHNIALDDDEEDDDQSDESLDDEDETKQTEIQYVRCDVTRPINTRGCDAIIVHCVGK